MLKKNGGNIAQALAEWNKVQRVTRVREIEPQTSMIVNALQAQGFRVIALTARPLELAEVTARQLASLDIHFSTRPIDLKNTNLTNVLFQNGILFVTPHNNKGQVMRTLIEAGRLRPSRVVFADDRREHVDNMEKELSEYGIPHLEFRYGAADATVQAFNPKLADLAYELFRTTGRLYPDNQLEAQLIQLQSLSLIYGRADSLEKFPAY